MKITKKDVSVLILVVVAASIYLGYRAFISISPCAIDKTYSLCFLDKDDVLKNFTGYTWKCGDIAFFGVNVTKLQLPKNYYFCTKSTKLLSNTSGDVEFNLYNYDTNTNTEFQCSDKLYSSLQKNIVFGSGAIPNITGRITFVELYIYPSNFAFNSINDFIAGINKSSSPFSLYGEVTC
jgi:hypothetical protein